MKTYLFAWNPKRWKWTDLPQAVAEAKEKGRYLRAGSRSWRRRSMRKMDKKLQSWITKL